MFMRISFESKGNFDNTMDWLKRATSSNPSNILNSIASDGTNRLASSTPRSTGETASGWKSKITTSGDITEVVWFNTAHPNAGVSIAKLIELGHGTRTGGYVPPHPYIKQAMRPVWDTVSDKVVKEMIK